MCVCDRADGSLLVHGGPASGCDGSPPCPPVPPVWHHAIEGGKLENNSSVYQGVSIVGSLIEYLP